MFKIKQAYSKGPMGDRLMVIDEERDVWLQFVSSTVMSFRTVFKLVWENRIIPFEIRPESKYDENSREYIVKHFHTFGGSLAAQKKGLKPYVFKDAEERRQAQLLAVEAVLAYGGNYDGSMKPDGYDKIEFEGRLYTKSDFGLP